MRERDYIIRFKAGDRQAFNALFEMYWAKLVSYGALIVGEQASKDIVQNVFVKVWVDRDSIHDCETLRPYLMRAVYNASLNVLRNKAKYISMEGVDSSMIDFLTAGQYSPDDSDIIKKLYTSERDLEIEAAILQLPPRCQEIFRLVFNEGKSHKEVAAQLGITVSTVDNQVFKALSRLREKLTLLQFLVLLFLLTK
jgi:RNA polymerase sigma-70 factor (ECF subfamily)